MTIAENHGQGWFARLPLARKAALAAAVPMAVGIGGLVAVQAAMLHRSLVDEAIRADKLTAELIADQMIGGMKWSKADVVGGVIDRVTAQSGNSVAHVLVLDRNGTAFAAYPPNETEPALMQTVRAMRPGETLARDAGDHVVVATPIGEFGTLVVASHMDRIVASAAAKAWIALGLGLAVALAVGVAILWFLNRSVIAPVGMLTEKLGRLAAGNHDDDGTWTHRADEIGRIAEAAERLRKAGIDARESEQDAAQSRASAEAERHIEEDARSAAHAAQQQVVHTLGAALERLAAGDLTHRISTGFPDTYAKLRDDLNAAFEALDTAVSQITENAEAVRTAATDIATASDDLSRRTESQAASLEQTAAAIEQITSTTRSTADNAARAREVVARAKKEAESGGEVVRQAIAAMSNIETSSEKIGQIIGLIDEISFQTNLLALNAGVEAARAGEAGKGFAVVASEVRALAQRSADAAKEIKGLIMSSKQEVEKGVELVGGTGEALERIISRVGEINGAVGEIATSAAEQATGLQEVNGAVSQMDQITQQNAAMVDKASIAVRALSRQTDEFARLVGRFTVARRRAPARPAMEIAEHPSATKAAATPKTGATRPAAAPPARPAALATRVSATARPGRPTASVTRLAPAKGSASVHAFAHKPKPAPAAAHTRTAPPAPVAAPAAPAPATHKPKPAATPGTHAVAAPPKPDHLKPGHSKPGHSKPAHSKPAHSKPGHPAPAAIKPPPVAAARRDAPPAAPSAAASGEPAKARSAQRRSSALAKADTGGWEEF